MESDVGRLSSFEDGVARCALWSRLRSVGELGVGYRVSGSGGMMLYEDKS